MLAQFRDSLRPAGFDALGDDNIEPVGLAAVEKPGERLDNVFIDIVGRDDDLRRGPRFFEKL